MTNTHRLLPARPQSPTSCNAAIRSASRLAGLPTTDVADSAAYRARSRSRNLDAQSDQHKCSQSHGQGRRAIHQAGSGFGRAALMGWCGSVAIFAITPT